MTRSRFSYDRDVNPHQIEELREHVLLAVDRPWPWLECLKPRSDTAIIVGGGPSLKDHLEELRSMTGVIFCLNHTVDFLVDNGITPWGCVFGEIRSWKPSFLETIHPEVTYLPASQCHPETLDRLNDHDKVILWHCIQHCGEGKIVNDKRPGAVLVGGGNSVLTRAINIAHCIGFRDFRLFGCDSSFNGSTHVYHDRPEDEIEIEAAGKMFRTSTRLAMQADHLMWHTKTMAPFLGFRCHADGLFPHIHKTMFPTIYEV